MLFLQQVAQSDVWDHWQRVERHPSTDFRTDIRSLLPQDLVWSNCEIQSQDIERLFIISSDDWLDISGGTFKVADVAAQMNLLSANQDTIQIATDIQNKISFLNSGGRLDSQLIAITDNQAPSARFTFIEGNRRSVAFLRQGCLVGISIFVGCSAVRGDLSLGTSYLSIE